MQESKKSNRLKSLDALRGFNMFWIVGGAALIKELAHYTDCSFLNWCATQTVHAPFIGFKLLDLIFPLFLFLAGVSIPYAIGRKLETGVPKKKLLRKALTRALILILLGACYNDLLQFKGLSQTRICSVLGLIGISYFFAVVIYLFSDLKHQIIWAIGILLGYWFILDCIPVPDIGAGVHTAEGSITGYLDRTLIPWHLYKPTHDPEGLLAHIPAIVTALFGAFTGHFIRTSPFSKLKNSAILLGSGVIFLIIGKLWGLVLPISKEMWTSSFVVYCAGLSLLLLGLFYLIIDALGYEKWAFFFTVIGLNPITIYLAARFVNFHHTNRQIFGGLIGQFDKSLHPSLFALTYIFVWWFLLLIMHRNKIYLKV